MTHTLISYRRIQQYIVLFFLMNQQYIVLGFLIIISIDLISISSITIIAAKKK